VIVNVAATVDGKIDTFERRGAPISTDLDRQRVDRLRAESDAIMVGGHTLLAEDPRLTVRSPKLRAERLGRGEPENPAKVSVVSHDWPRSDSRFLTSGPARVVLFAPMTLDDVDRASLAARGVEVITLGQARVDLLAAFDTLVQLGMRRLLVEGGGSLNFELFELGLVDEVQIYVAPLIFGGASSPTLADGGGFVRDCALSLGRAEVESWEDGGVVLRYMVEPR
jgi:2,5-diamino-6-(ribosylamino)-4(3H)-pyrimidinone 5'-phosphate reductase